jgi:hypothetical protein
MRTIEATCPGCHATELYGEELIGRYTLCPRCKCRFYVEVPGLEKTPINGVVSESRVTPHATPPQTTLDDLLWDTQQGSRFIIQSLSRQERRLRQIFYGLIVLAVLLAINVVIAALR